MELFIVDAFADAPFGGNPAGVVLLEDGQDFPGGDVMVRVAAELRYSETAFVRRLGPEWFHTRYFTPVAEVDLCGHATVAAFHVLRARGGMGGACVNRTAAGDLRVTAADGSVFMEMGTPAHLFTVEAGDALREVFEVMGLTYNEETAKKLPAECISTGLADILLPVPDEAALAAIRPDFPALAALSERYDVVGVHAFTLDAADGRIHCRNFAPRYAIDEEAATGTANGALTWYLRRRGLLSPGHQALFVQGEAMGRPSVVRGRLEPDGRSVFIGGSAVILAAGTLFL